MLRHVVVAAALALLLVFPASASQPDVAPRGAHVTRPAVVVPPRPAAGFASVESYARDFTLALPLSRRVLPRPHPLVRSLARPRGYRLELELVGFAPRLTAGGSPATCIVLAGSSRRGAPLAAWARAQLSGLRVSLDGSAPTGKLVRLPVGWALRASYRPGEKVVSALTYVVDGRRAAYSLSCSGPGAVRAVADVAARTFAVSG